MYPFGNMCELGVGPRGQAGVGTMAWFLSLAGQQMFWGIFTHEGYVGRKEVTGTATNPSTAAVLLAVSCRFWLAMKACLKISNPL